AGLSPRPLKWRCQALIGVANRLPGFHSNETLRASSYQTDVDPLPSSTKIISSYNWRCGLVLLPGGSSQTYASLVPPVPSRLTNVPRTPLRAQGATSTVARSST